MDTVKRERYVESIASLIDPLDIRRGRMVARNLIESCPENTNAAHVAYPLLKKFLSEDNERLLLKALALAPQQMAEASRDPRLVRMAERLMKKLERRGKEKLFPCAMKLVLEEKANMDLILKHPEELVELHLRMEDVYKDDAKGHFKKILKEMTSKGEEFIANAIELFKDETAMKSIVELAPTYDEPVSAVLNISKW